MSLEVSADEIRRLIAVAFLAGEPMLVSDIDWIVGQLREYDDNAEAV